MTISSDSLRKSGASYTLFAQAAQYTLDLFWQQVFEECSRGKFPRGVGMDTTATTIFFRKNGKNLISYKLNQTPEQTCTDLKKLFQEQLGLSSIRDKEEIRAQVDDICTSLQESFNGSWQQIRRKKIKDPIIRRFILDLKAAHGLSDAETMSVAQIIRIGFLFNWILASDIIYENQQILEIQSLHFDPDTRLFTVDAPHTNFKREYKPKMIKLSSLWTRYLDAPRVY